LEDPEYGTFMPGWVVYPTRKERTLIHASDPNGSEHPGRNYNLVKVIDIFSNDTSQVIDVADYGG
jgi:hypothetical protein